MLLQTFLLFHVLTSLGPIAHGSEIIDGVKVPEDEMLFMASVQVNGRHVCGGFLLTDDFVVTAAHCEKYNPTHVVVGAHDLGNLKEPQTQTIGIGNKFKPSSYQDLGWGSDIMLLKLSNKAQTNNKVATITRSASGPNENEQCHVAGWGGTRTGGPAVDKLMMADVPVISRADCKKKWPNLPANVICAGGYNTTKGFCQGDSGGPLVCNNQAVGVVSFNNRANCSYPEYPNVYTDISAYQDWIDCVIGAQTPHE